MLNIKEELMRNRGKRVLFRANRGRRKSYVNEGILKDTYDSVFTIAVNENEAMQMHSYTYGDILTKCVEIKII